MAVLPLTKPGAVSAESAVRALFHSLDATANKLDLDGFAAHFWDSPNLIYVYNGRLLHGWSEMVATHRESWADIKDASFQTGTPSITILSPDTATATAAGCTTVTYHNGIRRSGEFIITIVCTQVNGDWRIVQAHESTVRKVLH